MVLKDEQEFSKQLGNLFQVRNIIPARKSCVHKSTEVLWNNLEFDHECLRKATKDWKKKKAAEYEIVG